jgi:hypothetical protein
MGVDVLIPILVIVLALSILGHLISGYWSFQLMKMMLRELASLLRERKTESRISGLASRRLYGEETHVSDPMPPLQHYTTPATSWEDNH